MLTLTRQIGENIRIGDDIEIILLDSSPTQSKIGINAPQDVSIRRAKIYYQIKQRKKK